MLRLNSLSARMSKLENDDFNKFIDDENSSKKPNHKEQMEQFLKDTK